MRNEMDVSQLNLPDEGAQLYHHLFDAVPCYVSVQDRDFRILQANKTFIDAFGDRVNDLCYRAYKGRTKCNRRLRFGNAAL